MRLSCYIHRNPLRAGIVKRLADYRWSSYRSYGYGFKSPDWLKTGKIYSRFKGADKCKAYREKMQEYAKEEKKLWEDLRHGMIIGSKKYIDKIRSAFLPENIQKEIPQQRNMSKSADPLAQLKKSARLLDCDLGQLKQIPRISKADKDNRDLLVLSVWKTGMMTNEEIGSIFGLTYSSVSHIVKTMRIRMKEDHNLKERFSQIYSQFKI